MNAEVGAAQSPEDINAVADPAWLQEVHRETGTEPFLDDDGAVVIPVVSGNRTLLGGAPPDRTIKLPALGAHQARVVLALGPWTFQRVIIDAHERLREIVLDGSVDDLTINASRDNRVLRLTGAADPRVLRLQGGSFAIDQEWLRPTTVIDVRDSSLEILRVGDGEAGQLQLNGHVQICSSWRVRSSVITPGATIDMPTGGQVWLGIVNPPQEGRDSPVEMTLRTQGAFECDYLPPDSKVNLDRTTLRLQRLDPPLAESQEDDAIAQFLQAIPTMIERLTVTGNGGVHVSWDLESPTFSPEGGELALKVQSGGNVLNAADRVGLEQVAEDALCQGSAHDPLVVTSILDVNARRMRELRERRGWTAEQLASRCAEAGMPSLTRSVIANAESGRRQGGFTIEEMLTLAYVLDVAPVYFFLPIDAALVSFTPKWVSSAGYLREWVRGNYPLRGQDPRLYETQRPEIEWNAEKSRVDRPLIATSEEIKRWLEGPPTEGSE
jgi:transcriptional regulator with XRE-family HTH domain